MLGSSLDGKRLLVVGPGRIGRETARLAEALGARPTFSGRNDDLHALLAESDIVVLAAPLTPETDGMINAETLAMIKPGAWLINVARGGLVDEPALLEALDEGRLTIGEGTLLEPGCWLTLAPEGRIEIGAGCFLNRNTMVAAFESVRIGDHTMFANGCFVGDADHRFDDRRTPITQQGFTSKGPVAIGANCWFGVNCVVTSGVTIGERCVIAANSVVNSDIPPGSIVAGAPAKVVKTIEFRD